MSIFVDWLKKIERTMADMKFAVAIIALFACGSTVGTFVESYHGTDYAQRLIYKSWPFMAIQFFMFMSVMLATLRRLPPKKRLYGFYTLHLGLLLIFSGSLVTYLVGVDGTIDLTPNTPTNELMIGTKDKVVIKFADTQKQFIYELPYTANATDINAKLEEIEIKRYYPFAKTGLEWRPIQGDKNIELSTTKWRLYNANVSQEVYVSLHPEAEFPSSNKLGLLNIHYMPSNLLPCFQNVKASGILFWQTQSGECFTPEERQITVSKTPQGNRFTAFEFQDKLLKFFPDHSPLAVNDDLTQNDEVPFRVFSLNLFKTSPHLFLFKNAIFYFDKTSDKWAMFPMQVKSIVDLPWMKFKLRLDEVRENEYPVSRPLAVKPIQENSKIVEGDLKAIDVAIDGTTYYATSLRPLMLAQGDKKITIEIVPDKFFLPYQLVLERFVMETNPGTNSAASYESYVSIHHPEVKAGAGIKNPNHIYMNNPLKYDGLTFYQSSYYDMGDGNFGSVLSVNYDPGRWLKYLGSLLLVLGSFWHFMLNRKKTKDTI